MELSHVSSKMGFYQNISIYKEDADKVTQSRPIFFILCAEVLSNMIRKEKSIKEINISNILYSLSQYADDTQIFLDGSEAF